MKKRHILIVDDDAILASALKDHLKHQGFQVTLAGSCAEGQKVLSGKTSIDLMILDYLLPDGKGTELLEAATRQKHLQKPPVIMASSLFTHNTPMLDLDKVLESLSPESQSLVQACLPKPCSVDNIDTLVHLVFEQTPSKTSSRTILIGDYHDRGRSTKPGSQNPGSTEKSV